MSEEFPRHLPPGEGEDRPVDQSKAEVPDTPDEAETLLLEAAKEFSNPASPDSEDRIRQAWNRTNQILVNEGREPLDYDAYTDMVTATAAAEDQKQVDPAAPDTTPQESAPTEPEKPIAPPLEQADEKSEPALPTESETSSSDGAQNPAEGGVANNEPLTPDAPTPAAPETPLTPVPQPLPSGRIMRGSENRSERLPSISVSERTSLEDQYRSLKTDLDALTNQGVNRPRRPKDSAKPMPKMNADQAKMMELMQKFDQVKDKLRNPIRPARTPKVVSAPVVPAKTENAPKPPMDPSEAEDEEPVVGQNASINRGRSARAANSIEATVKPVDEKSPVELPNENNKESVDSQSASGNRQSAGESEEPIVIPPAPGVAERLREMAGARGWLKSEGGAPANRQNQLQELEDRAATAADSAEYWKIQGQIHDLMTQPVSAPVDRQSQLRELEDRAATAADSAEYWKIQSQIHDLMTQPGQEKPRAVEAKTESVENAKSDVTPEVIKPEASVTAAAPESEPTTPDSKKESEPTPTPEHITSLEDARSALAGAHRRERSWWSFGNKKELDRTNKQYTEALEKATQTELTAINKEFAGRDLKDEKVQAEYTAKLTGVALEFRMAEEGRFREALRGPEKQSLVDGFKTWWRKHSKARMITSFGLLGVGGVGALTGQFWITGLAAGARGALAGIGTGVATESTLLTAGRAWERKFGDTKELNAEQISQITNPDELERRIAAHTLDTVEAHRKDFGKREAGRGKKKHEDRTADLLQERYGTLLREQREKEITDLLKGGATVEAVTERLVTSTLGERVRVHDAYLKRIGRNKSLGKWRTGLGVTAGLMAGLATSGGLRGASQWVREHWLGDAPDKPSLGIVSDEVSKNAASSKHLDWADHRMAEDTAHELSKEALAPIVAEKGDSVWSMTEEFVNRSYPNLPPGQRTWIIDRFKDAIAKHPEQFGLSDPNHIEVGQAIDFTKTKLDLINETLAASQLPTEVTSSIEAHDKALDAWAAAHPNEMLTEAKADEILHGSATPDTGTSAPVEAATPDVAPAVEIAAATPVAEVPPADVTHAVAETLKVTPGLEQEYMAYQTNMMDIPDQSLDPLRQGFAKITLQEATGYGAVENFLATHPEIAASKRELLTTSMHRLAKMLLENGHQPNESVSAAVEWLRTNR